MIHVRPITNKEIPLKIAFVKLMADALGKDEDTTRKLLKLNHKK